ncbi:hypothetical protein AA23498_2617 [Acetobacter nitrogenifigens DSM 23921 = NBRC 105050]|nr:hypothetical protein AA23498_2617 [Acetobacter nitrogenifigens DSM 23921 = NBRC 105050]
MRHASSYMTDMARTRRTRFAMLFREFEMAAFALAMKLLLNDA